MIKASYPSYEMKTKLIKKDKPKDFSNFKFSHQVSKYSERRLVIFGKSVRTDEEDAIEQVAKRLPREYMKGSWLERKMVAQRLRVISAQKRITPIESDHSLHKYDLTKLKNL